MQQGWKNAALTLIATAALAGPVLAQEDAILTPPPGAPVPGPGLFVGPGPMGIGRPGGGAMMLQMPAVQAELKLTEAQKTKVAELIRRLRLAQRERFRELPDLTPEERQKRQAEWRADEEKQANAILTAEQQKRYRQLQLQQQGLPALLEPDVTAELKLTDDQRAGIRAALQEQEAGTRALFQAGPGGFDPEQMREKLDALLTQRDEKIQAALALEQRRQWQALLGTPFQLPRFGRLMVGSPDGRAPEEAPLPVEPPAIILPVAP